MKISSFVITRALIIFTLIAGVVLGKVRVFSPEKLDPLVTNFVNINENLSVNDLSEGLNNYLVNKGYTFTQVKISETAEYSALTVLPGVMGEVDISGNEQLSSEGILNKLGWKKGEPFNLKFRFAIEEVDAPANAPKQSEEQIKKSQKKCVRRYEAFLKSLD